MYEFISESQSNNNILQSALLSINLPVNILIAGNPGLGKKLLAKHISPNTNIFEASKLEQLINENKIDIEQYEVIILHEIDKLLNKQEFFSVCKNIKIIATSNEKTINVDNIFAVKLILNDLNENKEDLKKISDLYIKEAMDLSSNLDYKVTSNFDLSQNGISLKKSIYKSVFKNSMNTKDLEESLEEYIYAEIKKNKTYKDLLEIFEVPLLNAAKRNFKSQVKISNALNINRITLRKKLHKYFGA